MDDDITDMYRDQIRLQMHEEASRRLQEVIDPREDARVLALSLVKLCLLYTSPSPRDRG